MKHSKKLFNFFRLLSIVVTLFSLFVPAYAVEPGWYWTPNLTVPEQASKAAPALAVYNGQLHMVHLSSGPSHLYHSYYDGIMWAPEVRISGQTSSAAPALAVYDGLLHLVCLDSRSTDIYHSTYNGIAWSSRVKVSNYTSAVSPAIATFDGKLHLVYKSETSETIYHCTYDGSAWTALGAIPNQGTKAAPALAVYGGSLHMVHLGTTSNDLWHSVYNGTAWSAQAKVLDCLTQAAPALSECNEELHMVYKGETTTDIYHASFNGTSWTARGIIPNQSTQTSPAIASYNGPMHIIHLDDSSTDLYESFYLGQVCAIPAFQPDFWNYYNEILRYNNCYNYSNNKRTDTFAQPGRAAGQMYTSLTCPAVEAGAIADGISKMEGECLNGENKIALVVAPDFDYHWYRMDSNGLWSHKPGGTPATNLDNSGELITNPETADRGNYTDFCGYFCTCSDDIQGISHEYIRGTVAAAPAAAETIEKGLKVTVMIFSGRPNPIYLIPANEKGKQQTLMGHLAALAPDCFFKEETVIPAILGYSGIIVEKVGDFKEFPYDRLYIYKENIETHSDKADGKQFFHDGAGNLQEFFLQLALEKGAINQQILKYIK